MKFLPGQLYSMCAGYAVYALNSDGHAYLLIPSRYTEKTTALIVSGDVMECRYIAEMAVGIVSNLTYKFIYALMNEMLVLLWVDDLNEKISS